MREIVGLGRKVVIALIAIVPSHIAIVGKIASVAKAEMMVAVSVESATISIL
jgi:hypothetical protein